VVIRLCGCFGCRTVGRSDGRTGGVLGMRQSDRPTVRPSIPTVASIARPNVGKSTLFNRIIGRRQASVAAQPGVTRDRHVAPAEWNGRRFWLVDTGGLVVGSSDPMNRAIRSQVEQAVADSDALLFVVDIESGIHPMDLEIAQYLRKVKRPL